MKGKEMAKEVLALMREAVAHAEAGAKGSTRDQLLGRAWTRVIARLGYRAKEPIDDLMPEAIFRRAGL
ncbi:MAG TPA: hypothetical protein VLV83_00985 [Acidobacteriota bacterium]|nr:hypothetical protein [Acidobacteriota bacterium]